MLILHLHRREELIFLFLSAASLARGLVQTALFVTVLEIVLNRNSVTVQATFAVDGRGITESILYFQLQVAHLQTEKTSAMKMWLQNVLPGQNLKLVKRRSPVDIANAMCSRINSVKVGLAPSLK